MKKKQKKRVAVLCVVLALGVTNTPLYAMELEEPVLEIQEEPYIYLKDKNITLDISEKIANIMGVVIGKRADTSCYAKVNLWNLYGGSWYLVDSWEAYGDRAISITVTRPVSAGKYKAVLYGTVNGEEVNEETNIVSCW